jgi:hypothetical protein
MRCSDSAFARRTRRRNCEIALPHAILSLSLIVPHTLGRNAVTHRAPRKARNQMCP